MSHKLCVGFVLPMLVAGLFSHAYMERCRETGKEQEQLFLSVLASAPGKEATPAAMASSARVFPRQPAFENSEAWLGFNAVRARFDAFMRGVEYAQYAFAGLLLLLAVFTVKTILIPIAGLASAAESLREGHLGTTVPVRSDDELGALASAFNLMSLGLKEREEELLTANRELTEAMKKIKTLAGLLPICAACKKIRDDKGYWQKVENFFSEHSDLKFTHGLCPECMRALYPDIPGE